MAISEVDFQAEALRRSLQETLNLVDDFIADDGSDEEEKRLKGLKVAMKCYLKHDLEKSFFDAVKAEAESAHGGVLNENL